MNTEKQLQNITFVASNLGEEYYEKDLALYEKLYPASPALKEFKEAPEYRKVHYQERMLLEILNEVCTDSVLENRGFVVFKGEAKKLPPGDSKEAAQSALLETDIANLTYAEKKALAKVLDLKTANQKDATLTDALNVLKEKLGLAREEAEKAKAEAEAAEKAKAEEADKAKAEAEAAEKAKAEEVDKKKGGQE